MFYITHMRVRLTPGNIFRACFLLALIVAAFLVPAEYAAFLAMLYVWLIFADYEGHLLLALGAFTVGVVVFAVSGASLWGFAIGIVPIILVSWLAPSVSRRGTGGWITNKGGMGAFYDADIDPVDAARAQRRKDTNRTIRWNIWR